MPNVGWDENQKNEKNIDESRQKSENVTFKGEERKGDFEVSNIFF